MSNPYSIAGYFSPEARQAASETTYRDCPGAFARGLFRRTSHGECPLGVMLRFDGYGQRHTCPDSTITAKAIFERSAPDGDMHERGAAYAAIRTAAGQFINAFDAGEIDDLPAALGCGQKEGPYQGKNLAGGAKRRRGDSDTSKPAEGEKRQQTEDAANGRAR